MRKLLARPWILVVAVCVLAAQAAVADTELVPADETFYLAWQDCGSDNDTYLSTSVPESNSCAWYGLPANEAFNLLEDPWVDSYSTEDGTSFVIDAARNLQGEIHVHSPSGVTGAGLGQVIIEGTISVEVPTPDGVETVGAFSAEGTATPDQTTVAFPIDIDIPDHLQDLPVEFMTLDLIVRGLSVDSSTEASGGLSKLVVPTLVPAADDV